MAKGKGYPYRIEGIEPTGNRRRVYCDAYNWLHAIEMAKEARRFHWKHVVIFNNENEED